MPLTDPEVETVLKPPVLFLHGQAFSAAIWERTGSLQLVASLGHRGIAVDLPGYGRSVWSGSGSSGSGSEGLHGDGDLYQFLAQLIQELHLGRPVIVAPSMSGKYALPYLLNDPSTAFQRVRGLIAIAPAYADGYSLDTYRRLRVPVLYVFGSLDDHLGKQGVSRFAEVPGAAIEPIEGAGHACYVERPDTWRALLHTFLQRVQATVDLTL